MYSRSLADLNSKWESVKLLCEVSCPEQAKSIMPNMMKIQNDFSTLQTDLINSLASETLNKTHQKAQSKAQAAVDILIRNLYERTADVGFLATDGEIQRFTKSSSRSDDDLRRITERLRGYQEKYTVYDEIIILDECFNVIANLDKSSLISGKRIDDPLLSETMSSDEDFIETFRYSALQPDKPKAHIFSKKITKEGASETVGVLCLCFRFDNEVEGIFKKLNTDYDGSVISIIDSDNVVIASSDKNHLSTDTQVESVHNVKNGVVYYRGAAYIAKTVPSSGYQGYFGLGFKGHIMMPLELAFKDRAVDALGTIKPELMNGLMNRANAFSKKLYQIMEETKKINSSLKRIIYNGQIIAKDSNVQEEYARLRPILQNIEKTGSEICKVFDKSVKNLFATVISASLREDSFLASHCIDIMDRNLYERANDCRWWALNPRFKEIMSQDNITEADKKSLTQILQYINSLYTVYTVLFLFDKNGKIIAVSNPSCGDKIGCVLSDEYIRKVASNYREDEYFVSPFKSSDLYSDKSTYIYSASITDCAGGQRTVGGIGIVFDSEFQFETMLKEAISVREDAFAIYTDRQGFIISSTNQEMIPGRITNFPKRFLEIKNGESNSEIIVYDNAYYVVGYSCSCGYREYKNNDGYKNDVIAFVFERLALYTELDNIATEEKLLEQSDIPHSNQCITYGTFMINGRFFGLDQSVIVESIESAQITALPEESAGVKGIVKYRGQFVTVLDMHMLCGDQRAENEDYNLLIIRFESGTRVALMVDRLINVLEIGEEYISPAPKISGASSIIKSVVSVNSSSGKILLIIDERKLLSFLNQEELSESVNEMITELEKQN